MSKKLTDKQRHDKCVEVLEFMIENEKSLTHSLKKLKVAKDSFYLWVDASQQNKDHYARVRKELIELKFESIESDYSEQPLLDPVTGKIDTGWVQLQRLKIDAKKWELSKLKPEKYGDKVDLTTKGDKIEIPLFPDVSTNNSDK